MSDRIESGYGVKRCWREIDGGHIGVDEVCEWHVAPGQRNLSSGAIHTQDVMPKRRQMPRYRDSRAAPEIKHPSAFLLRDQRRQF
jgi:hypothetical protein